MQQALRRPCLVPTAVCCGKCVLAGGQHRHYSPLFDKLWSLSIVRDGSRRMRSHYLRRVTELPLSGRIVLVVVARRFRCDAVLCGRQIFTERLSRRRSSTVGATHD